MSSIRTATARAAFGPGFGLLIALVLFAGALPSAHAAKRTHFRYRVVKAVHSSSTTGRDDSIPAVAHSTSRWKLAKPKRKANNQIGIDYTPVGVAGGGMFNLRGTYRADATVTNGPTVYHCELVAPTGSRKFALVAPDADQLTVLGGRKGLTVAIGTLGGGAQIATAPFGGGYFESGCKNPWHVNSAAVERARTKQVSFGTFHRKKVKLRFRGGYTSRDTTARWNTLIVLKRIDRGKKRGR